MTKQLSKDPAEYEHKVAQALAAKQLVQEGIQASAGQNVSYTIEHGRGGTGKCVSPSEPIDGPINCDVEQYTQLLLDAVKALLSPEMCDGNHGVQDSGSSHYLAQKTLFPQDAPWRHYSP
jgi:DNA polymerase elongation subunit (family B)